MIPRPRRPGPAAPIFGFLLGCLLAVSLLGAGYALGVMMEGAACTLRLWSIDSAPVALAPPSAEF